MARNGMERKRAAGEHYLSHDKQAGISRTAGGRA
jgi:hypothetical protein